MMPCTFITGLNVAIVGSVFLIVIYKTNSAQLAKSLQGHPHGILIYVIAVNVDIR